MVQRGQCCQVDEYRPLSNRRMAFMHLGSYSLTGVACSEAARVLMPFCQHPHVVYTKACLRLQLGDVTEGGKLLDLRAMNVQTVV